MTTAALSSEFQIVIPEEIRRRHQLEPGQNLMVIDHPDHIEIRPVPSPDKMIGLLKEFRQVPFEREEDRGLPDVRYYEKL